jgi:hypothetical protein
MQILFLILAACIGCFFVGLVLKKSATAKRLKLNAAPPGARRKSRYKKIKNFWFQVKLMFSGLSDHEKQQRSYDHYHGR